MDAPSERSYEEVVTEILRDDPEWAAEYLNEVLTTGDQSELMEAIRRVAHAFGGVPEIAERSELNAKTLYRTLSPRGNPELKSLIAILKAMGMRLAIQPLHKADLGEPVGR
ncbi:MAG: helix-turn-helix domain-containing transcriptional regulator [Leptospirales bacterium]